MDLMQFVDVVLSKTTETSEWNIVEWFIKVWQGYPDLIISIDKNLKTQIQDQTKKRVDVNLPIVRNFKSQVLKIIITTELDQIQQLEIFL